MKFYFDCRCAMPNHLNDLDSSAAFTTCWTRPLLQFAMKQLALWSHFPHHPLPSKYELTLWYLEALTCTSILFYLMNQCLQAATQCYIELVVKESDNNVKLIVLDRLMALKEIPTHKRVLEVSCIFATPITCLTLHNTFVWCFVYCWVICIVQKRFGANCVHAYLYLPFPMDNFSIRWEL